MNARKALPRLLPGQIHTLNAMLSEPLHDTLDARRPHNDNHGDGCIRKAARKNKKRD